MNWWFTGKYRNIFTISVYIAEIVKLEKIYFKE